MEFRFEELRVYQEGLKISSHVFTLTNKWPSLYRFTITDQLSRAALSIPLNIAEGSSRTNKDFQHFLSIARGSCYECIPLLEIAKEKNLLMKEDYLSLRQRLYDVAKMLSALRVKISK